MVPKANKGAGSAIGNIIWFVIAGWWLTLVHIVTGVLMCLTIIGIPLGLANFKLITVGLRPFGREIVSVDEARRRADRAADCRSLARLLSRARSVSSQQRRRRAGAQGGELLGITCRPPDRLRHCSADGDYARMATRAYFVAGAHGIGTGASAPTWPRNYKRVLLISDSA